MATVTLTRGKTLPDTGTKTDLHELIDNTTGAVSNIVNADISNSAAIAGSKIAPAFGSQDMTCKDITASGNIGCVNVTASGELDGATLDISGNADIDGTLETDAITLNGAAINAASGIVTLDSNAFIKGKLAHTAVDKKSSYAAQQAATDCFIVATVRNDDGGADTGVELYVETGDSSPDVLFSTALVNSDDAAGSSYRYVTATAYVAKGQYWSAALLGTGTEMYACWLVPLGD